MASDSISLLRLRAGEGAAVQKFLSVVEEVAASSGMHSVARVDCQSMESGTPAAVMSHVGMSHGFAAAHLLGDRLSPINVLTDVAAGRDLTVNEVHVTVGDAGADEMQRMRDLLRLMQHEIDAGKDFTGLLIIVDGCDGMAEPQRRLFANKLWRPALRVLSEHGAKIIFHANEHGVGHDDSWPPRCTVEMRLPDVLELTVVEELAQYITAEGLEEAGVASAATARTIFDASPAVSDLYEFLWRLEQQRIQW